MAILEAINLTTFKTILGDGDGKADALVRLGATDRRDNFIPNINSSKWDDEAWINLNPTWVQIPLLSKTALVDFKDSVASVQYDNVITKSWVLNPKSMDYAVVFASKPTNMELVFDLQSSGGLRFLYQDDPKNEPSIPGEVVYRPDNVIGSYEIYLNKCFNKYKTGKFGIFYRWQVTDANLKKEWCSLLIDSNKFIVTLPKAFMDNAKYPVVAKGGGENTTFGWETVGATAATYGPGFISGVYPTGGTGTLTNIDYYCEAARTDKYYAVCYLDATKAVIGYSDLKSLAATTWERFLLAGSITNADHVIGIWGGDGALNIPYNYTTDTGQVMLYKATNDASPPTDPLSGQSTVGRKVSIHADYTPAAGGLSIPRPLSRPFSGPLGGI